MLESAFSLRRVHSKYQIKNNLVWYSHAVLLLLFYDDNTEVLKKYLINNIMSECKWLKRMGVICLYSTYYLVEWPLVLQLAILLHLCKIHLFRLVHRRILRTVLCILRTALCILRTVRMRHLENHLYSLIFYCDLCDTANRDFMDDLLSVLYRLNKSKGTRDSQRPKRHRNTKIIKQLPAHNETHLLHCSSSERNTA